MIVRILKIVAVLSVVAFTAQGCEVILRDDDHHHHHWRHSSTRQEV